MVVVNVVIADHRKFGCIAGLAGAQDDAQGGQAEVLADRADGPETSVVSLHHHIQQNHGNLAAAIPQHLQRLDGGMSMKQLQPPPENFDPFQRETGGGVDLDIVVDHQQPPHPVTGESGRPRFETGGDALVIFDDVEDIVVGPSLAKAPANLGNERHGGSLHLGSEIKFGPARNQTV